MKTHLKSFLLYAFFASTLIFLAGCDDDDEPQPQLTGESKTYTLAPVSNSGVAGTVTFAERDDERVLVTINLTGAPSGGIHPAHVHVNSAAEGGAIVLSLNAVNGGKSETAVNALDDGTAFSYDDVAAFDGHVNVHVSADDLSLLAQADIGENELSGETKEYVLGPFADPEISGTAVFAERLSGETLVTVSLENTSAGETHKSHIHANSAAETGVVVIDLSDVDGATGMARTNVSQLNDGTPITYDALLDFDGYINVHSGSTFIAQGDIGGNELTGEEKIYTLGAVAVPAISGTATFAERKNGNTLVTVDLENTVAGESYLSHIHANSIVESGGIVISLENVDGTTGMAMSTVRKLDDKDAVTGAPITYDELLNFNGYLNVHGAGSFIAQGDIGGNELTGETKTYTMMPVADPAVTGTATFAERKSGATLVTVALQNTTAGTYSSHIHANTIAEGGGIVINLNSVDGTSGMARTTVRKMNDVGELAGAPITYDELLGFNGYLNVHGGGSFIVQGDIGQNELTGVKETYPINELNTSGVSGTATFEKRANGKTQITLALTGTVDGGDHPAHIHANDAATGGGIVLDLKNVNGATGKSVTSANALKNGTAITYDELVNYNGHINVHESSTNLGTRIAQGNIGSNVP